MILLIITSLGACRDASAPAEAQCRDGYAHACFEAALDATTSAERHELGNLGEGRGNPISRVYVRDINAHPWGDRISDTQAQRALHAYGVWCSRGKVAACYEVGNWLAYDFASPAAAVRPYQVACDAKFEDACFRAKQARIAADQHLNQPMPSIEFR